jgi:hypothetical protein
MVNNLRVIEQSLETHYVTHLSKFRLCGKMITILVRIIQLRLLNRIKSCK